jgi:hypothetical protein
MAGELRYSAQRPVVSYHGADLADGALTARASPMLGELPAALLIDDVDALATAPRLMSPLGTLLGRLCDRGTRVAMACRTWTPDLDILLSLSTAGGVPATRVRCLPPDIEIRRGIVARMSDACGAEADADAVDLLARTSLPHADQLVALAGRTLAHARLSGSPVTAESVASALRRRGHRRPRAGSPDRAARPRPVHLAQHLGGALVGVPEPGLFPSRATDALGGFGALGGALTRLGRNQRLAIEEQPDCDRGHLARRAAIQAALAGRTVLLHTPDTDAEVVAQSLVALLCGVADATSAKHRAWVQRVVARAEVMLGGSPLYLSDDPAMPMAHAGSIAREVERRYGRRVELVVTEGAVLDRPLDTCPLEPGAGLIASTGPGGLVGAAAEYGDCAWVLAHHGGRLWGRRMVDDWSEVGGPGAPRQDGDLLPLMRDETGAAVGWRLWSVRDRAGGASSLVSPVKATPWPRGVLTSSCTSCGDRPTAGCTCGIYAHSSLEDAVLSWLKCPELVAGKVRAWGTVIRHTDGFRAQHVQIGTLYVSPEVVPLGDELARRYDCSIGPW